MLNEFWSSFKSGTDIRGVAVEGAGYDVNITDETVEAMTNGFILWLSKKTGRPGDELKISVGRDSRISGPQIAAVVKRTLVNAGVQNVQNALSTIAANQGMNTMQVINSIQSGNSALASQLCQCCCQQQQQIMAQGYENQIRTIEQTNVLQGQNERNTAQIRADIAAQTNAINEQFCAQKERELQSKIDTQADIITQLRGQIDNANQTNQIIGYVNSVVSPLQTKVDQIASKQLPTVNVQWPQLTAVNTTPYVNGGFYGNNWNGWNGNGWGGNIVF